MESCWILGICTRFTFDTLARAKNEQLSGINPNMIIVLKCIKRYFTREFDISISLGGGSGRPTGTCIWHRGTRTRCTCSDFRTAWSWSFSYERNDGKRFKKLCKFVRFNARNLTRVSVKALFSAVRETSLMRFLAVPGAPVHTTVLGGCAHPVRVPRCQRRHWGGRSERAAERNRILEKYRFIHLSTMNLILACPSAHECCPFFARAKLSNGTRVYSRSSRKIQYSNTLWSIFYTVMYLLY